MNTLMDFIEPFRRVARFEIECADWLPVGGVCAGMHASWGPGQCVSDIFLVSITHTNTRILVFAIAC